jgi:hypothetical protein
LIVDKTAQSSLSLIPANPGQSRPNCLVRKFKNKKKKIYFGMKWWAARKMASNFKNNFWVVDVRTLPHTDR